jgi:ComF family protein
MVKGEQTICSACLRELPYTNHHLDSNNLLSQKLTGRIPLTHASAFLHFKKGNKVQKLLHALKYKNQPEIGIRLGRAYGHVLKEQQIINRFDLIVPVPLHQSKLRQRGYNQSAQFANGLAEVLEIPVEEYALVRKIATSTQTQKTKLKRWQNVSEVFEVAQPGTIQQRKILLVDDVVTTGATLEACGNTLLDAGASGIGLTCIAFTQ